MNRDTWCTIEAEMTWRDAETGGDGLGWSEDMRNAAISLARNAELDNDRNTSNVEFRLILADCADAMRAMAKASQTYAARGVIEPSLRPSVDQAFNTALDALDGVVAQAAQDGREP